MTSTNDSARACAERAAITFEAHDPTEKAVPTAAEWTSDSHRLHLGLTTADAVLCQTKEQLMKSLAQGDAGELLDTLMATLEHAAEGFEHFKTFCEAAQARVLVAGEALMQDWPADA